MSGFCPGEMAGIKGTTSVREPLNSNSVHLTGLKCARGLLETRLAEDVSITAEGLVLTQELA